MAERNVNVFQGYSPTVRDHTVNEQIIVQGEITEEEEKAQDRINKAERGELKAKLAALLDRGIVQDRLHVELPDHLHGEWVTNDPLEIRRLETLGFRVDTEYASSRAIHSDGSNSAIVGDVIHVICNKEIKEVIDEIKHDQMVAQHRSRKKGKMLNKEEVEYIENVEKEGDSKVIAYSGSTESGVSKDTLQELIGKVDSQVKPSGK